MKRKKQKNQVRSTGGPSELSAAKAAAVARAKWSSRIITGLIAAVVVTLAVIAIIYSNNRFNELRDLTVLGNGKPTIVQVHDAECASCVRLQKNLKRALKDVDKGSYNYVLADLKQQNGRLWAGARGLSFTTLVFADPDGEPVGSVVGERTVDVLDNLVDDFLGRY